MRTKKQFFLTFLFLIGFTFIATASFNKERASHMMNQSKVMGFTENKGQVLTTSNQEADNVLFSYKGKGVDIFITNTGISYVFSQGVRQNDASEFGSFAMKGPKGKETLINNYRTDMLLEGATISAENIIKRDRLTKSENIYYNANNIEGIRDVGTWKEVLIKDVYPGIDWVLYVDNGSNYAMKYDFIVKPGANPADIKMVYKGAQVSLEKNGTELKIRTDLGNIHEGKLLSYQNSKTNPVNSAYLLNENEVSFDIDNYNINEPLTIDPPVIIWSTNFGGEKADFLTNVTVDSDDNLYVYGSTRSLTLPGIIGGSTNAGSYDLFITKFNSIGELLWSALFGGADNDDSDAGGGIVVKDNNEEIYFCGASKSTDFPIKYKEGAYNHSTIEGGNNAVIVKISSQGDLLWSTFIGGNAWDYFADIAIDNSGYVYLMGFTSSNDFPIVELPGAFNNSVFNGGTNDGILLRLDENDQLNWSTYFGGSGFDQMFTMEVGPKDHLYIVGYTDSFDFTMVEKEGAYFSDVFLPTDWSQAVIMEFNEDRDLIWSTYFGGGEAELARSLAWDADNNFYVVGETESDDMPVVELEGAYFCGTLNNNVMPYVTDAFILKFNKDNHSLVWSTYFGGDNQDLANDIAFDEQGRLWICGATVSTDLPIVNLNETFNQNTFPAGKRVMFWSLFSETKELEWSTFYGGDGFGWGYYLVNRLDNRLLLFTQAETDEGMSSGLIADNPLAYQQGDISSNDIVIIEFLTGESDNVGVIPIPMRNHLHVYPNPFSDLVNIVIPQEISGGVNIKLIDITGRVIVSQKANAQSGTITLNSSMLEKGLYVISLEQNNQRISRTIVK